MTFKKRETEQRTGEEEDKSHNVEDKQSSGQEDCEGHGNIWRLCVWRQTRRNAETSNLHMKTGWPTVWLETAHARSTASVFSSLLFPLWDAVLLTPHSPKHEKTHISWSETMKWGLWYAFVVRLPCNAHTAIWPKGQFVHFLTHTQTPFHWCYGSRYEQVWRCVKGQSLWGEKMLVRKERRW